MNIYNGIELNINGDKIYPSEKKYINIRLNF